MQLRRHPAPLRDEKMGIQVRADQVVLLPLLSWTERQFYYIAPLDLQFSLDAVDAGISASDADRFRVKIQRQHRRVAQLRRGNGQNPGAAAEVKKGFGCSGTL